MLRHEKKTIKKYCVLYYMRLFSVHGHDDRAQKEGTMTLATEKQLELIAKFEFKTGDRVRHLNKDKILANPGSLWQRYENAGDAPFVGTVISSSSRDGHHDLWDESIIIKTEFAVVKFDDGFVIDLPVHLLKKI